MCLASVLLLLLLLLRHLLRHLLRSCSVSSPPFLPLVRLPVPAGTRRNIADDGLSVVNDDRGRPLSCSDAQRRDVVVSCGIENDTAAGLARGCRRSACRRARQTARFARPPDRSPLFTQPDRPKSATVERRSSLFTSWSELYPCASERASPVRRVNRG